jgi:hypothetical protein
MVIPEKAKKSLLFLSLSGAPHRRKQSEVECESEEEDSERQFSFASDGHTLSALVLFLLVN